MDTDIDPQKYCEFYLVRHGETEANRNRIIAGDHDTPLTQEGIEYLKQVADSLKNIKFDAIYASDLQRAISTAEILRAERELEILAKKELRERFQGSFEGKPVKDYTDALQKLYPDLNSIDEVTKFRLRLDANFETMEEAGQRYILALREIAIGNIGKRVLVVGHGTALRSFMILALGGNPQEYSKGRFNNGGWVSVYADGVDFFIKELNIKDDAKVQSESN